MRHNAAQQIINYAPVTLHQPPQSRKRIDRNIMPIQLHLHALHILHNNAEDMYLAIIQSIRQFLQSIH